MSGKGSIAAQPVRPGDVSVALAARAPLTHRVVNAGATTFEVVDVEILKRPKGPAVAPIVTPVAENGSARAYRWTLAPGAETPQHTHERPCLIVAATPLQLRMTAPGGSSMEHQVKAGDVHWVDARVTHVLANGGAEPGVIVEVELH